MSLNLLLLGLGAQTVKNLRWLVWKFDLNQREPKSSQVNAKCTQGIKWLFWREIYGDPIFFGSGPGFVSRMRSDPAFVKWALTRVHSERLGMRIHQIEAFLKVSKLQNGGLCDGFEQQTLSIFILTKAMASRDF